MKTVFTNFVATDAVIMTVDADRHDKFMTDHRVDAKAAFVKCQLFDDAGNMIGTGKGSDRSVALMSARSDMSARMDGDD